MRTSVGALSLVALLSHGAAIQSAGGGASSPIPDGTPLQGEQFPRFLTPNHQGQFGFNDLLVLGDYVAVQFERHDPDEYSGFALETWARVTTRQLAGRLVSVFRLTWTDEQLRIGLRSQRWGLTDPISIGEMSSCPGRALRGGARSIYSGSSQECMQAEEG